jgi:hypothetical protein
VETEEQREFLAQMECHSFQGYLFSPPVNLDKFERMLPPFSDGSELVPIGFAPKAKPAGQPVVATPAESQFGPEFLPAPSI